MNHFHRSILAFTIATCIASSTIAQETHPQPETQPKTAINQNTTSTANTPQFREALPLQELQIFADVFQNIRTGYVEEVDDSTLFEYAVRGMLDGLDPHSAYLNKEDYSDLQTTTDGEFSGLGIEIDRKGSYLEIISPIDGSPAVKAGLKPGDIILKLDDIPVKGLSINESVKLMRGKAGSPITLEIGRPGTPKPFEITVIRDKIKVASVNSRVLAPGFGYLRIAQFQRDTGSESINAIKKLITETKEKSEPIKGLVLDLRNNPGGILDASVEVSDLFLNGGSIVYTEGRHPSAQKEFFARPGDLLNGLPIVVLINGGSASASEIVAGALQDHRRAIVMGTRSFGKGSVQIVLPVSENRAVKLTTALYFTPKGRSIQAEGIVPNIVVERATITSIENQHPKEVDLQKRLDTAKGSQQQSFESESEVLAELRENDNQLYEALTLLRGVTLFTNFFAPSKNPTSISSINQKHTDIEASPTNQ